MSHVSHKDIVEAIAQASAKKDFVSLLFLKGTMKYLNLITPLIISLLVACTGTPRPEALLTESPHSSYHAALVREDLDVAARRWVVEAAQSLEKPVPVSFPYFERRLLDSEHNQPATFAVDLESDQLVKIAILPSWNAAAEVFVDVFLEEPDGKLPQRIASMASADRELEVSAVRAGRYLIRVQPTHSSVGLVDTAIWSPARFGFPVVTDRYNTVKSFFGAPRDGGARRHEGIDIFAARGTDVLAATGGRVVRVGETPMGGKQVWVRDGRHSFYYAHLDSIGVARGARVERGQVIGTVGNTGNAITTKPHLHFGVYKRRQGAIDPLPLVGRAPAEIAHGPTDVTLAPRWLSVTAERLNLRSGPSVKYSAKSSLARGDLIRVDAATDNWLRVTAGCGRTGFVSSHFTGVPVAADLLLESDHAVALQPQEDAPIIAKISAGQPLSSLGQFGEFMLVRTSGGVQGWARADEPYVDLTQAH